MDGAVQILPLKGMPRVRPGDRLAAHLLRSAGESGVSLEDSDVVVVTQKVVSKSEGRLVALESIKPRPRAIRLATKLGKDPRTVQMILGESKRIIRQGHGVLIVETHHGFICANAGIDQSNVEEGYLALLPVDPDVSARKLRKYLEKSTGKRLAVVITDTFGRPWRNGHVDVAIGCSGIAPLEDLVGTTDPYGHKLRVTQPALVDELAAASELVMRKHSLTPACVVKGLQYRRGYRGVRSILRDPKLDLFR
ncbi:MAG: coenzyme F420-0:L-glutamate ligase [Nitrososphaerota archaeon]|nr:coenzyme F420-0:L-glutamate ligase [Nitrososphaerota archaeon]